MRKSKIPLESRALTRLDGQFWHSQNCDSRTEIEMTRDCRACQKEAPLCNFQRADGSTSPDCFGCREKLFRRLSKRPAAEPKGRDLTSPPVPPVNAFEHAFQKALLAGGAKHKALTLKGLRAKKAWSAYYALEAQARKLFASLITKE